VEPNVRSPIQCKKCWRFGHIQMFCRGKPRCDFCASVNHLPSDCPTRSLPSVFAVCANCHSSHVPSDRSCSVWIRQKDLKKLMVVNKITFKEVFKIKDDKICTSAFSFLT
jgi:hypothetical protein